jgi:hypothetical protein
MTPATLLEPIAEVNPSRETPASVSPRPRTSLWILLVSLGLFAALALPFFQGKVYVADDLGEFHLPVRDFYARQLSRGESFDWMPSLYGGFYISAEGQLGGYHPWHWILYRLLPLQVAFDLELLASYPLLFAGTYLFLRRLVGRRDAALFGALTFTFGGFSLLHFIHPNAIAVVAHLPWILWAIDVALTSGNPRSRIAAELAVGFLVASQLLLGYPQYVWFTLLAAAAYCVYQLQQQRTTPVRLLLIALAIGLGFLMGAVQLLPTRHLLAESVRQAPDAAFANTGSMHLLNLVQLVAPYLFTTRVVGQNTHELGLYIGAVPLVLCVWFLSRPSQWERHRTLVKWLLAFTVLATLLAAGEFGGLYRLQSLVPLANRFRFPCRGIVLVQFCLAALAAVSTANLFTRGETAATETNRNSSRSLLGISAFALALAIVGPLLWPEHVATPILVWAGPILVGTAALLVFGVERGVRGCAYLLVLFTAIDLGIYGLSYSVYGRTANLSDYVAATPLPPSGPGSRIAAPNPNSTLRTGDRLLLAGSTRVDGYAGLEPAKQFDYSQRRSLQLAGVQWVLLPNDIASADASLAKPNWQLITPTSPRARLVDRTSDANLESLGSIIIIEDAPGRLTLDVESNSPRFLTTTESFDSGWTATENGQTVAVVRVDGDFLGCPVTAGKHRVQLHFQPEARAWGMRLSLFGLGFIVLVASVRAAALRPTRVT